MTPVPICSIRVGMVDSLLSGFGVGEEKREAGRRHGITHTAIFLVKREKSKKALLVCVFAPEKTRGWSGQASGWHSSQQRGNKSAYRSRCALSPA